MTDTSSDAFVVHKFGGTSVGSASCFAQVSDIVSGVEADRLAVVVSAIGGKPKVTDLLIKLLDLAKKGSEAECDEVLDIVRKKHKDVIQELLPESVGKAIEASIENDLKRLRELLRAISIMSVFTPGIVEFVSGHGELWSARILAAILTERTEHTFHFIDARDFLIVEPDEDHGPVVQYELTKEKINAILKANEQEKTHVVITGFICSTADGVMTTLQRDGSDFTAAICGRVLNANSITIWTDVSGVLSADPRRVPESRILPEISYEEAMELAYFGAKVIHPKTMTPAVMQNIPIFIRNTFEPSHPGTKIHSSKRVLMERKASYGAPTARNVVSGFSTVDNLALFNLEGSGIIGVHGTSSRLFGALDRVKVNVVLIAQASSEHSICFAVPMARAEDARAVVNETFFKEIHHGLVDEAQYIAPVSIIAAVGDHMNHTPGVCSRFFGALGRAKMNILAISQGSSERNISAVVRYKDSAAALRAVHAAFSLSDHAISMGIIGLDLDRQGRTVGKALLTQFAHQRQQLKKKYNVDLQLRAVGTHSSNEMLLDDNGGMNAEQFEKLLDAFEKGEPMSKKLDNVKTFDPKAFEDHVCADHLPHWLLVDVSRCANHVTEFYSSWVRRGADVITSNVNLASTSAKNTHAMLRKSECMFDVEACLAIGVPVFRTLQSFVETGDTVERIEYVGSPALESVLKSLDARNTTAEQLQKLLEEQVDKGESLEEVWEDITGLHCAKNAVLLACELGLPTRLEDVQMSIGWDESVYKEEQSGHFSRSQEEVKSLIRQNAQKLLDQLQKAVEADTTVHLLTSLDVTNGKVKVELRPIQKGHSFASLQPAQCGFAFFTERHAQHPVVVTGPIADCDITAGSLFGSMVALAHKYGGEGRVDSA